MRVLVACDWFLKYAAHQATALARAGVDVRILCRTHAFEFGGSAEERASALAALDGVSISALPGRVSSLSAAGAVRRLRKDVRTWRPDVVHAHDNADPRLLAIVRGRRRVITIHDPTPHPGQPSRSRVEDSIRRHWITGSDAVIVHGAALVDELPAWVRQRRVAVVPHGATVLGRPLAVPSDPVVLLFGRLEPYKGLDVLLRAMERVWNARPDVRLHIAGRGSESDQIPSDPRIGVRAEYVPEAELQSLFATTTLAVLPYTQGSQSGVGSVALGYGVPTIVSDVGALEDLAADATFVVPAGDDHALAGAILAHLDHDESMRSRVLAFARDRLSWDACARRTLEVYRSLDTPPERS